MVREATKTYGSRRVLDGVTLSVRSANITALAGINGSGKTTLFHATAGFLKLDSGDIAFEANGEQRSLVALSAPERVRLGIAYIPQVRGILRSVGAADNLRIGLLSVRGMLTLQQIADELAPVQLTFALDINTAEANPSQALWLLLARAYLARPRFLLADEPFAGLDAAQVKHCVHVFQRMRRNGTGILIADHRADALLNCSRDLYILETGRVAFKGTSESARFSMEAERLYFKRV